MEADVAREMERGTLTPAEHVTDVIFIFALQKQKEYVP